MSIPVRQSTAFETSIGPVLDADGVAVTGGVVADLKIKKTTGNFAALNGSATLTHVSAGVYDLVLTTSDLDTVGLAVIAMDDTVNACAPLYLQVMEEAIYDALYAASANAWSGAAGSSIGVANATQFAGQAITAAAGVTLPSSVASPTNITAGTITTVTNLTNLPAITANWLTAAGIAAAALNGKGDWNIGKTGYALSSAGVQAIWDALTSALTAVGSIGKLLVDNINATISSRLASASYTAPPTVGQIADQVWDETLADHLAAGGTGNALNAAGSAGDPWSTALPGAYGAGTAGKIIGDNVNATISSRASQTSVDDVPTNAELAASLPANFSTLAIANNAALAKLGDLAHGGTAATLRLGGSTTTPAFYVTNSGGDAVKFESTGNNAHGLIALGNGSGDGGHFQGGVQGDGFHLQGGATTGRGLHAIGPVSEAIYSEGAIAVAGAVSATSLSLSSNMTIGGNWTVTGGTVLTGTVTATDASNDIRGVGLTSAYDFAKGTVAMTESYAANGAAMTPVQGLHAIHQMLMAFSIAGVSLTVKKLDNATTAFIVTLDDATDPTGAARS